MKRFLPLLASVVFGLATPAAHAAIHISGSLSNFDCWNDDGDDADGFEIELEDCSRDNVTHTYAGSAFGGPTVKQIDVNGQHRVIVRYKSSSRVVVNGGMTHFGVSLAQPVPASKIHYRWLHTFGGVEVPIEYICPIHEQELVTVNGKLYLEDRVINPSSYQTFFLMVHEQEIKGGLRLENLLTEDPSVSGAPEVTGELEELPPLSTYVEREKVSTGDDEDSTIFWYEVYNSRYFDGDAFPNQLICVMMDSTGTQTVEPTTISGSVDLQDFYGDPTGVQVQFELRQNGQIVSSPVATLDATGHYSLSTVWRGNTEILMKANHWLVKNLGSAMLNSSPVTKNASLINGDVDNDNAVTVFDYGVLSDYFDKGSSDADWDTVGDNGSAPSAADLDGDGVISVFDYGILSNNFDKFGD